MMIIPTTVRSDEGLGFLVPTESALMICQFIGVVSYSIQRQGELFDSTAVILRVDTHHILTAHMCVIGACIAGLRVPVTCNTYSNTHVLIRIDYI